LDLSLLAATPVAAIEVRDGHARRFVVRADLPDAVSVLRMLVHGSAVREPGALRTDARGARDERISGNCGYGDEPRLYPLSSVNCGLPIVSDRDYAG
jgi:hypothetical protein